LTRTSERHSRYPFGRGYARTSAIIVGASVATLLLLTYPQGNLSLYQNAAVMTLLFAAGTFAARYVPFRRLLHQLRSEGRITIEKPAVKETGLVKGLMIVGILLLVLLPFFSVRFADPLIWMSALFGYIIGMNAGEFSYYLYVRNLEASMGRSIYKFDFEDPITSKRITGYRLEKITD